MEGYRDYCPLSRAAEIFATRWTPIIVRNLLLGCETFSELREGAPGISRTLLTQRLRLLEHHGIVERRGGEAGRSTYALTQAGWELAPVCAALGSWGEQWIQLSPEHFDATKVMWGLSKDIAPDTLPDDRTVVRFDVTTPARESYWLLLDAPNVEVCDRPPTDHDDVIVRADVEALVRWHLGEISLGDAMAAGGMAVDGPLDLERMVAGWGGSASVEAFAARLAAKV